MWNYPQSSQFKSFLSSSCLADSCNLEHPSQDVIENAIADNMTEGDFEANVEKLR